MGRHNGTRRGQPSAPLEAAEGDDLSSVDACAPLAQADNDQYDQYMISHGMVSGDGTNGSVLSSDVPMIGGG